MPERFKNIWLCEKLLYDRIHSSEVLAPDFSVYRSERLSDSKRNKHGGSLVALSNNLESQDSKLVLFD